MKKLSRNEACWCGSGKNTKMSPGDRCTSGGVEEKGCIIPPRSIIKTEEQIAGIRRACQLSREILDGLQDFIVPE